MADITLELIKEFRSATGAGIMEAKEILKETNGNLQRAIEEMRKRGQKIAAKKSDRATGEGLIECYVHTTGKLAAVVELGCETDFVARNAEFKTLAHDLAMHVAAANPQYVSSEDVPADVTTHEREVVMEQLRREGKPEDMLETIAEGKLKKFYEEVCLLQQPFIKDDKKSVQDVLHEAITKIGENIKVRRFARWVLGQ